MKRKYKIKEKNLEYGYGALFWASSELLLEYDFHTLTKENEIFSLSNSNTRMMGRVAIVLQLGH